MPPLEAVTVSVSPVGGAGEVSPKTLTFTPDNWTRPQAVTITAAGKQPSIRLRIPTVQFDQVIDLGLAD